MRDDVGGMQLDGNRAIDRWTLGHAHDARRIAVDLLDEPIVERRLANHSALRWLNCPHALRMAPGWRRRCGAASSMQDLGIVPCIARHLNGALGSGEDAGVEVTHAVRHSRRAFPS